MRDFGSELLKLESKRPDLGFEGPDLGSERPDLGSGRPYLDLRGLIWVQ